MDVLERIGRRGHEGVYVARDEPTRLATIIAVHSTVLGPALGGTRFFPYRSFDGALDDVLRLSRAMTYKAAAAGLELGGGKAVIVGDPASLKSDALLEAYGRAVDRLGGTYVTAEDVGTTVADMHVVRRTTRHVAGLPLEAGGSGDPSPATARGVRAAMRGVARHLWGDPELTGRRVAIQGVGKVGGALAELLAADECELVIGDVAPARAEAVAGWCGARVVPPDAVIEEPCDIVAPCALGDVIGAEAIVRLKCSAVVGSANNVLTEDRDAERLAEAGIAYPPDFVVNAGGIVNIAEELHPDGYDTERAVAKISRIEALVHGLLAEASKQGTTALAVARRRAEDRLAAAGAG